MARMNKKEVSGIHFSYLDVFFLLLAGCILSVGIYFYMENTRSASAAVTYLTEARCEYREELLHAIPAVGEAVLDENGQAIGTVLSVENDGGRVKFVLRFTRAVAEAGESFRMETARAVAEIEILSVTEEKKGEAQ